MLDMLYLCHIIVNLDLQLYQCIVSEKHLSGSIFLWITKAMVFHHNVWKSGDRFNR